MMEIETCPVCRHSGFSLVFPATDSLVSGRSFDILECRACGVRITHPIPDEREIERFYDSEAYCPHSRLSSGTFERTYSLIRKMMVIRKRRLIERGLGLSPGRLLDVGCGEGTFLNEMRRAGWQVEGVDTSPSAREMARERYGLRVVAPGDWFTGAPGKYRLVTFWHALEHVHDVNRYLQAVRDRLETGGWVIIAAPNYQSYDARRYRHLWAAYDVPRHLYHFHYPSMTALLYGHGLSVVELKSLPFDSFYISILSEKRGEGNVIRGLWVGLRSYLSSLSDARASSSIVYVSSPRQRREIGTAERNGHA